MRADGAANSLEVAFQYPIKLIANALGVPPAIMLELGKSHGVPVAALVGAKEHAVAQVQAGVDILVVAGGEAGGHCGEVSTMVLIPEVHRAVKQMGADTPILAAGGITTGGQMAAAMAMGAAGAWCGSVWLTTTEAETNPIVKQKMLAASSRDTVRSRSRTGKPSRQLALTMDRRLGAGRRARAAAHAAADAGLRAGPAPCRQACGRRPCRRAAARHLLGRPGRRTDGADPCRPARWCRQFKEDFAAAYERLSSTLGD